VSELVVQLERHGRELSQQVLADMYRDPFWSERFGERGRRHADEDSDFHLRYLRRALESRDAGVMLRYAQWLRGVLSARGMCTRHLVENFQRLARTIAARGWPGHEEALGYLEEASAALMYPGGMARELQEHEEALAAQVAAAVHKDNRAAALLRAPQDLRDDVANLFSYLADACSGAQSGTFVTHVQWLRDCMQRAGRDLQSLHDVLAACDAALGQSGRAPAARSHLTAARAAIRP
jgi:hypothetical protein